MRESAPQYVIILGLYVALGVANSAWPPLLSASLTSMAWLMGSIMHLAA